MLKLNMKKIIYGLFLVIFILIVFFIFWNKKSVASFNSYNIDGKSYYLLEAKNPADWIKGLMFYKSKSELKGADGMMFIFPIKQKQSFWNENTYLNLEIYWMDGETVIGKSYLPSILTTKTPFTVNSQGPVDRVAEIAN